MVNVVNYIIDKKAVEEYREYNKNQPIESDFDKDIKRLFNAVKK